MDKNEALEIIKKNYPHVGFSGSELETALRTVAPELAESEDERIRKELIDYFRNPSETKVTPQAKFKEWYAWLEKQKDEVQRQFNLGVQAGREEAMYEMEKEQNKKPKNMRSRWTITTTPATTHLLHTRKATSRQRKTRLKEGLLG